MHMIFKTEQFTHETLLLIMPFGGGYLCQKDGEPWTDAVMTAIALLAIQYSLNPSIVYEKPLIN